jgi:hypothetical protein
METSLNNSILLQLTEDYVTQRADGSFVVSEKFTFGSKEGSIQT